MRKIINIKSNSFVINSEIEPHIFISVHIENYNCSYSNKTFYYISTGWCGNKICDNYTASQIGLPLQKYREIITNKWAYTTISCGDDLVFLELEHVQIALEQLISYFVLNNLTE